MTELQERAKRLVDGNKDLSKDYLLFVIKQFVAGQKNHNYEEYQLAFYQMWEIANGRST